MPRGHRRSIRLRGYDYTKPGAYFLTICTADRAPLFGEVVDGDMRLNALGQIIENEWLRSETIRQEIVLDAFVVMPNHLHGIVFITSGREPAGGDVGAHGHAPLRRPPRSLGSFVAEFKSAAALRGNRHRGTPGLPLWQRGTYEHIIRDEQALARIRRYIVSNPARWREARVRTARGTGG
jgi:putative transposase